MCVLYYLHEIWLEILEICQDINYPNFISELLYFLQGIINEKVLQSF